MTNVFLKPNNPLLYKVAKKLEAKNLKEKWFLKIVKEMKDIAGVNQHNEKNKTVMVGLAAPQIGYSIQLVFVDVSASSKRDGKYGSNIFMVNPEIISKSKRKKTGREGCYSAKLDCCDVDGVVERHEKVKVKYLNLDGVEVVDEFVGFTSVIVQHEVDHLNGKVFVHRIKKEKDLHLVFPSEIADYRKNFKKWKRTLDPKLYWKDVVQIK
jgi:peptide deformylase